MTKSPSNPEDRYKKACDVWFHLYQVEQLVVNDTDYKRLSMMLSNCIDIVETLQHEIEISGK